MNIPKKIRIGSMDYDVIQGEETLLSDGQQLLGEIDHVYHTIKLDTAIQDRQGIEISFLHELVHGILNSREMHDSSQNEKLVDELAKGLHQVIRDNPSIFWCRTEYDLNFDAETAASRLDNYIKNNLVNKVGD